MTIPSDDLKTLNGLPDGCARSFAGRREPVLLTEADLDQVAAAGSKPGASSGAGAPIRGGTRPT